MTLGDDLLSITDRYDRELAKAEAATMARINAAYDASYRQLVDDLRRAYSNLQQAGSISALVRKGAILQELGDALEFINPNAPGQYRTAAEQLIQESVVLGEEMGGETLARLGTPQSTFTTIPIGAVRFQAESFTQRLVNYSTQQASQISAVVEQGLIQGWGVKKVEANLKGLGVSFKSNAETVARTEQMSAYNGAALNRYEQAGAKYLQWIAAPSERLCPTCGERNGKIYQIKDFPQIPAHPRCRCTSLAILNPEDVDTEFFKEYREEGLADLKAQGLKPDSGLTYWEKKAGLTSAPKPVWVPGQPLPKLERMEALPAPVLTSPVTGQRGMHHLPPDHVVTTNQRFGVDSFDNALDLIDSEGGAERVQLFRDFVNVNDIQVVIHDVTKSTDEFVKVVEAQLKDQSFRAKLGGFREHILSETNSAGYTNAYYRHVVIYSSSRNATGMFEIDQRRLLAQSANVLTSASNDETMSSTTSGLAHWDTRSFVTYLHEMGHQVYFKGGIPNIPNDIAGSTTDYGATNEHEWFAEHFALWMLDEKGYSALDPVGSRFIRQTLQRAITKPVSIEELENR